MLSVAEISAAVERVTYLPGWTFQVYETGWEDPRIRIVAPNMPDAYHPDDTTDLGVNCFLPPFETEAQLFRWLEWRLERIASHEVRELFRVDGAAMFDPHVVELPIWF